MLCACVLSSETPFASRSMVTIVIVKRSRSIVIVKGVVGQRTTPFYYAFT